MGSSQPRLLCRYHYDPLDRLSSHARPDVLVHHRFYCQSRLATEIQGALRYSIFQRGDLLLAEQHRHGDALDTTLLATDQQRSVLHVFKSNAPQQPFAYSPYGHRQNESGLTSLLGYNGERPDPVTRHYLLGNGYRAFNPVLMRFNSPDSWSPLGRGGLNAYAYCQGNPVLRTDPSGHVRIIPFSKLKVMKAGPNPPVYLGSLIGDEGTISAIGTGQSANRNEPIILARNHSSNSLPPGATRYRGYMEQDILPAISPLEPGTLRTSQNIQQNSIMTVVPTRFHPNLIFTEWPSPTPSVQVARPAISAGAPPSIPQRQRAQADAPRVRSFAQASGTNKSTRHGESFNVTGPFQMKVGDVRGMTLQDLEKLDLY